MNEMQKELLNRMDKFRKLDFQSKVLDISKGEFGVLGVIMLLNKEYNNSPFDCDENIENMENLREVTVGDIANRMNISKPQLSKLLNHTDEKGYTKRKVCEKDKRVTYVSITEEGRIKATEEMKKMEVFSDKVLKKLGEEDALELARLFDKMYNILEEEIRDYVEKRG